MKRERLLKLAGIILEQQPKDYVVDQHQGSTKDQLLKLISLATGAGLYDAADYLESIIKNQFKEVEVREG